MLAWHDFHAFPAALLKKHSRLRFKREKSKNSDLKWLSVFSDINGKWIQKFKATVLQAGAYQLTSRDPDLPIPCLGFRSSTPPLLSSEVCYQVQLPYFQAIKGSDSGKILISGYTDSYKWSVQALWQAAHLVTDELVSWKAEPMYLANDRTAMLIESMWIVKKSKYRLYTKCPWWIDSSSCALLPFQCIHSNYTCNSKFSLNLFLFAGTLKHCASKHLQMTKYYTLLQGRIWVHILN